MNKSSIVVMVIALIIIVAAIGYFALNDRQTAQNSENNATGQNTGSAPTPTGSENSSTSTNPTDDNAANETTIVYSDSGFFPKEVTVKKGSMVTFKNESLLKMWPASAKHPTHEVYPGSGITNIRCVQGNEPGRKLVVYVQRSRVMGLPRPSQANLFRKNNCRINSTNSLKKGARGAFFYCIRPVS